MRWSLRTGCLAALILLTVMPAWAAERIFFTVPIEVRDQAPNVVGGKLRCSVLNLPPTFTVGARVLRSAGPRMSFELHKGSFVGHVRVMMNASNLDLQKLNRFKCVVYACADRGAGLWPGCNRVIGEVEGFLDTSKAVTLTRRR